MTHRHIFYNKWDTLGCVNGVDFFSNRQAGLPCYFKLGIPGFRCFHKAECQGSIQFLMHTNFTTKPYSRIKFNFSVKHNFTDLILVSNPILASDLISVSNLILGLDLILLSNLFWKRDSQFNSTQACEMKGSLAKFVSNTQSCTW